MTKEEAYRLAMCACKEMWNEKTCKQIKETLDMAIRSLEAWEIIKDNLSHQVHHNLDVKENFEIGSTSRIECNTTASVLSGVIYLIDRYLSVVER